MVSLSHSDAVWMFGSTCLGDMSDLQVRRSGDQGTVQSARGLIQPQEVLGYSRMERAGHRRQRQEGT